MSARRVRAIFRRELREYRRKGSIIWGMLVLPLIFILPPLIEVSSTTLSTLQREDVLLYMLGIPALVPAVLASYSVVGERQQATLEPVLTTPVRREEFLLGKALAVLIPSVIVSYLVYAIAFARVGFFAPPGVSAALLRGPELIAQVLFTPLLAIWSIWLGVAISTRSSDVRVAQQLGMLANLPSVAVIVLVAYGVIHPTLAFALAAAVLLLLLSGLGWRLASAMFDRERLITATR